MKPALHACNKNLFSYYDVISGLLQCCKSRIRNAILCLVVYASSPKKAEADGSPWIQDQTDLWRKSHVSQGYAVGTSLKQAGEQKKMFTLWRDLWRNYIMSKLWVFFFFIYTYVLCAIFFWTKQNKYFSLFKNVKIAGCKTSHVLLLFIFLWIAKILFHCFDTILFTFSPFLAYTLKFPLTKTEKGQGEI